MFITSKKILSIFTFAFFILSCKDDIPKNVKIALKYANKNKNELIKVINYYKNSENKEKLAAVYFLIANMPGKYGLYYSDTTIYHDFIKKINSVIKISSCKQIVDDFISQYITLNPEINHIERKKIYDIEIIKSNFLINNIELAFKVWKEKPWAKNLSFNEFCEWILPYRILNEPLQPWRQYFIDNIENILKDSLNKCTTREEACVEINKLIASRYIFHSKLGFLPIFGGIDLWNLKAGECIHRYALITLAMRSMGIPVSIDFTYQYASWPGNHSWTVLLSDNGRIKPFNGGELNMQLKDIADCPIAEGTPVTTIFRRTYTINTNELIENFPNELCPNLTDKTIKEVTYQYDGIKQGDISMKLKNFKISKFAFLFSFERGLNFVPVAWSKINKNDVCFKNIGKEGVYFIGFITKKGVIVETNPFVWTSQYDILFLEPNNDYDTAILFRKYPIQYPVWDYLKNTRGSLLLGSNDINFKKSDTLLKIQDINDEFNEYFIDCKKSYRFYRYKGSDSGEIRLAEIELISNKKSRITGKVYGYIPYEDNCEKTQFENAFDRNIHTNFNAPPGSWVTIDVGEPVIINSVRIIIRNHFNIVEPGHEYELFYFDKGWHSLGKKVANDYFIKFYKVPLNTLLVLKDLTEGIEERIFVYNKQRKQGWW